MSKFTVAKQAISEGRLFLTGAEIYPYPLSNCFYVVCHFSEGDSLDISTARSDGTRMFKTLNSALLAINALRGFGSREVKRLECVF